MPVSCPQVKRAKHRVTPIPRGRVGKAKRTTSARNGRANRYSHGEDVSGSPAFDRGGAVLPAAIAAPPPPLPRPSRSTRPPAPQRGPAGHPPPSPTRCAMRMLNANRYPSRDRLQSSNTLNNKLFSDNAVGAFRCDSSSALDQLRGRTRAHSYVGYTTCSLSDTRDSFTSLHPPV